MTTSAPSPFTAAEFPVGRSIVVGLSDGSAIGPNGSAVVASCIDDLLTLRVGKSGTTQKVRVSDVRTLAVFPELVGVR